MTLIICNFHQVEVPLRLEEKIVLVPDIVRYFGEKELQEYTVTSTTVDSPSSKKVRLVVSLKRHTTLYWLETFVPTMFLIAAAQLTLFINETYFEATVMVALTTALVM